MVDAIRQARAATDEFLAVMRGLEEIRLSHAATLLSRPSVEENVVIKVSLAFAL